MGTGAPVTADGEGGTSPARPARAKYAHPLVHYESIYGTKLRAIKRWIAIGRDATARELPPLDEPARMKAWWVRCMSQRVPEKLATLASTMPEPTVEVSAGPLFATPVPAETVVLPAPTISIASAGVGFAGALQRCRSAEAAAGELYTTLLRKAASEKNADERMQIQAEAEHARRAWDDLVDRLRAMERDAEKILSAGGRMWSADDVMASQEVIHLALREGIRGLIRRVRPKLPSLAPAEQEAIWFAEVESLFAGLRANKFTAPPIPALAA